MKRHLAVLTAMIALAGVAACDKDSDKDKPKPATSASTGPSAGAADPGAEFSKPPLPDLDAPVPANNRATESAPAS